LTGCERKIEPLDIIEYDESYHMSEPQTPNSISQEPVNILFSPSSVAKKDVWDIDLIQILNLLIKILEKSGKKDLKVAGMAALSSSLIYRMKVESIFALQRAAMEKKPMHQRTDVDIELINIPFRHESTYPVSLDDLLGLLQNLIGTIANPQSRRNRRLEIEPIEAPNFQEYFISLESIIGKYEDLIMKKISPTGFGLLQDIIAELDEIDSIRCFFAILFLARDQKVDLEQIEDDIKITIIKEELTN
jgi:segregation and condensation protein A